MFRGLRFRLTLLYLMVAIAFTALMLLGTRQLIEDYFRATTDLALHYRMAQEFSYLGINLPPELVTAVETWGERRSTTLPTPTFQQQPAFSVEGEHEQETGDDDHHSTSEPISHEVSEEAYNADLAPIYTLPLDEQGVVRSDLLIGGVSLLPDPQAVVSAASSGHDLRTIQLASGTRVRLLTYAIPGSNGSPAFLQLGRPVDDQQRSLDQITLVMSVLGGLMLLVMSGGSWWLAGRSLSPAEQAWTKQQAFIANAGHELRTPLTLMRANADVALRNTPKDDSRRERLEDLLVEADHMGKLVEDLLLLSRLDVGVVELQIDTVDLSSLFMDLFRQMGALAEEKKVSLHFETNQFRVLADLTRLTQVLLILLDNALRHTPAGGEINVSSSRSGDACQINIRDTGPGISPAHLAHVFERFYQVERGETGTGLGLAIAKDLIEAMDGKLSLSSQEGQGTTASIWLPTEP